MPTVAAQTASPKREVRAVWLTTLNGLDWPRTKATTESGRQQQQQELCDLLDRLKAARINTVLLQTRVRGTVIYPSGIEPWDNSLTGTYGRSPGYDPLRFAIEECHKRGMELHAWLVTIPCFKVAAARSLGNRSVLRTNPSLCKRHNDTWYLDPGVPGTADYLAALGKEVAENYDVDGIHFDYIRYPENAASFPDQATYRKYGRRTDKATWRRENITRCVRRMYETIKQVKPWIKVSSSPIGKFADLQRYSSRGWNAYNAVYQDAQGWLREGIHDMLFPMLYFQGDHFYPFAADWQECSNGRPVVPGLGIYFLSPAEKDWELSVIERELNFIRSYGLAGQAYFRSQFLTANTKGLYDYLQQLYYPYLALTPACTWLDSIAPSKPDGLERTAVSEQQETLHWRPSTDNRCGTDVRYNLYASREWPVDISRPEHLVAVNLTECRYTVDRLYCILNGIRFAVTAIDRFGNESEPAFFDAEGPQPGPAAGMRHDGQCPFSPSAADRDAGGQCSLSSATAGRDSGGQCLFSPSAAERDADGQCPWSSAAAGMKHDGHQLPLPPVETEFIILTDAAGRILRAERYTPLVSIADLPAGAYTVRTLQAKGRSRRIGSFFK